MTIFLKENCCYSEYLYIGYDLPIKGTFLRFIKELTESMPKHGNYILYLVLLDNSKQNVLLPVLKK